MGENGARILALLVGLISVDVTLTRGQIPANGTPAYRCLAPFVWSVDSSRRPANLFEVFLLGPFDRVLQDAVAERPDPSIQSWERGWDDVLRGNDSIAARHFRQAWEDSSSGEALVSLALLQLADPGVAAILARSGVDQCDDPAWKDLGTGIGQGRISTLSALERWSLDHPEVDVIRLFVLREALSQREDEKRGDEEFSLPLGWASSFDAVFAEASGTGGLRLRLSLVVERYPNAATVRRWAIDHPDNLLAGVDVALARGDLILAGELLNRRIDASGGGDRETARRGVDLAWRSGQSEVAKEWLDRWEEIPCFTSGERDERERSIRSWRSRLGEKDLPGEEDPATHLRHFPGHVEFRVRRIAQLLEDGRARDALYEGDAGLRRLVASADERERWVAAMEPLARVGRWRDDWSSAQGEWTPPAPPGWESATLPPAPVRLADGGTLDLSASRSGGRLVLFYNGIGCPACQSQLRAFRDVADSLDEMGVEVVAVSAQEIEDVSRLLGEAGESFPFRFASDAGLETFRVFGFHDDFENYPLHGVAVLDGEGRVRWAVRGYEPVTETDFLVSEVARLLSKN